jgi:hypothetical protein
VAILDFAKEHMQRMHYQVMKPFSGDRAKLLYTDTDSLIYLLETEDSHADMNSINQMGIELIAGHTQVFDMSGTRFPASRDKTVGLFKDEGVTKNKKTKRKDMHHFLEWAALAAKMYAFKHLAVDVESGVCTAGEKKTGKGVPKATLKASTTFASYMHALLHPDHDSRVTFQRFASKFHIMEKRRVTKRALVADNDKVFLLGPEKSRPLGHWRNVRPEPEDVEELLEQQKGWPEL